MKSIVLSALLCLTAAVMVQSFPTDTQLLKVPFVLEKLRHEAELQLGNKLLNLKFLGKQPPKPVILIGDDGKTELPATTEHELYHDKDNDATITVSTFVDELGNIKKHIRGSIIEDGVETVVEPHQSDVEKRSADEDDHVRVYKRQLAGRLPTDLEKLVPHVLHKRQTGLKQAYVETLVVCDFTCFNQHAGYAKSTVKETVAHYVESYLAHVMHLADLHYTRTFEKDTQLKINLYTKSYLILTTAAASLFTTDPSAFMTVNGVSKDATGRQYVNGDKSLNMFNSWLVEQTQGALIPSFDIAVAFVNANLFTPSADLLGIAPMAGTCTAGRNGVLVEDSGNFGSGSTTAHEVAHNLAVEHDINSNSAACTDEMNYVMSTSNKFDNRVNSFFFSSCSIASLKNSFLVKNQFPCTANAVTRSTDYNNFVSFKQGQLLTADEQCKRANGPTSKLMLGNKAGGGTFQDDMCKVLWCTTDYNSASAAGYATEYTSCGDSKWCIRGSCVVDAAAPKGQCLVEDDTAFCNDFLSKYGMTNVCNNFKTGRCCKMCGGTLIPRLGGHDTTTLLKGNTLGDVAFLDKVYVPPCVDKYTWCPTNVASWKISTPNICGGSYSVNGEPVDQVCRKSCGICV